MEESLRTDILRQLKNRNKREVKSFEVIFAAQERLQEQNLQLRSENSTINFLNERLKEENVTLKSKVTSEPSIQTNENYLELQRKLFSLQEELTELHRSVINGKKKKRVFLLLKLYFRRKGDNAQQVIDLTAALKVNFENISLKIFAPLKNICCEGERGSNCGEAGRHRDAGGGAGGGEGGPQDRGRADRRARVHQPTAQGRRWGKYFTSEKNIFN